MVLQNRSYIMNPRMLLGPCYTAHGFGLLDSQYANQASELERFYRLKEYSETSTNHFLPCKSLKNIRKHYAYLIPA